MKHTILKTFNPVLRTTLIVASLLANSLTIAWAQETLDRTVLPIREPKRPTYKELDARNVKAPVGKEANWTQTI